MPATATAPLASDPSSAGALPVGLSVCPLATEHQPELLWRSALRCSQCLAYINQFCTVGDGAWKCALCGTRNPAPTLSASLAPELSYDVAEYAEPFAQPRRASEAQPPAPLMLFVVDENAGAAVLRDLRAAVSAALEQLPMATSLGLVTFGMAVSVYVLSPDDVPVRRHEWHESGAAGPQSHRLALSR